MKRNKYIALLTLLLFSLVIACEKDDFLAPQGVGRYPAGFSPMKIPADNPMSLAKVDLGKRLFYDPILSRDSTISCATCHLPELAFTDAVPVSIGIDGKKHFRNSPTLVNVGYLGRVFMDGGVTNLEIQVIAPIVEHFEMDNSINKVLADLRSHPEYPALFDEAFNEGPSPFTLTRSIAAFQRSLVSGNSPFDQYYYQGDASALNASEIRGMELFFSDALKCSSCHSGFLFTNLDYLNNGIYSDYGQDSGRMRVTLLEEDRGKFKVPTLRNIEVTGPYMHDGGFQTLEEVIDHYMAGGQNHPNQDPRVSGFTLTNAEKQDLINFLHSLTDDEFLNNPDHRYP
jgi:cytochrome c peroxidase